MVGMPLQAAWSRSADLDIVTARSRPECSVALSSLRWHAMPAIATIAQDKEDPEDQAIGWSQAFDASLLQPSGVGFTVHKPQPAFPVLSLCSNPRSRLEAR